MPAMAGSTRIAGMLATVPISRDGLVMALIRAVPAAR
jgi:hypothetical protein